MLMRRVLFTSLLSIGCAKSTSPAPVAATPTPPPAAAPTPTAAPQQMAQEGEQALPPLQGPILEKIDAAGYSYLRLGTPGGDTWAAVPQTTHAVGAKVEVVGAMRMDGFESKTLQRRFDKLIFGKLAQPGGAPAPVAAAPVAAPQQAAAQQPAPQHPPGYVPPAANNNGPKSVADIHAQRNALRDATVTVLGKVVKSNSGIMGRTWLHLQDGSGSAEKGDNDITCTTTQDNFNVGDSVVVQGKVRLDKDFGGGYRYAVIIEDASVKKQ